MSGRNHRYPGNWLLATGLEEEFSRELLPTFQREYTQVRTRPDRFKGPWRAMRPDLAPGRKGMIEAVEAERGRAGNGRAGYSGAWQVRRRPEVAAMTVTASGPDRPATWRQAGCCHQEFRRLTMDGAACSGWQLISCQDGLRWQAGGGQ